MPGSVARNHVAPALHEARHETRADSRDSSELVVGEGGEISVGKVLDRGSRIEERDGGAVLEILRDATGEEVRDEERAEELRRALAARFVGRNEETEASWQRL